MEWPPKKQELVGEPTIHSDIVFKNGIYVATGIDPYFDANMTGRIEWMTRTNGGKNVPPGDNSFFAREAIMLGLPSKQEATVTSAANAKSDSVVGCRSNLSRFCWLGDPTNMEYTGNGDSHQCSSCNVGISNFVPGDTFLNQHAFFTKGECPYLKANYSPDRLKIEIGQERFRRGFIAHPHVITAPDAWNRPKVEVKFLIYVTLAERHWCYMCGNLSGAHAPDCYRKMTQLISKLKDSLYDLKV
jgi:hypothetical protein